MRLKPRSLFGRLVLVLLAGLLVAQVLSLAVHMHDRGELLSRASGMHSAQRIADIVRLLDTIPAAERPRIVAVLSAAPLTISLGRSTLPAREEGAEARARAMLFDAMLRRLLGDDWRIEVAVTPGAAGGMAAKMHGYKGAAGWADKAGSAGATPYGPGMHYFTPPGLSFVALVRLRDGTPVLFDARQPAQTTGWPYRMLLSLAVLLAAVIGVSLMVVRWVTKPLDTLADAAEELGNNINRAPLQESGPLEVVRAAHAFNVMQTRLIRYLNDRARILAAMSHDLKTPITRLRLRAEMLDDPQLRARFARDLEEMETMVGATLDFLRGLGSEEVRTPTDIMSVLEALQSDAAETGARVSVEGRARTPYPAKPLALKRCLANLLDNAIKYGKSARIVVSDNEECLEIRVLDDGPGIPQPEIDKVFEPFYRLEQSRSRQTGGTGLGLTIARSIAENHGGRLELRNRPEGGLEAKLMLPRARAAV